ncbi:MAG: potassium transporter Kup [Gemmatimonadetes bacterium]|nr:potassium transporter Kup [Gemmatimonadota bacterium]
MNGAAVVPEESRANDRRLALTSLAALGVVYGDIGTSPIYAIRESLHPSHQVAATTANVLGILSLIFWALVLIITAKYQTFVLRADNRGEGGTLALTSLATSSEKANRRGRPLLVLLGLFGASLLYGDSMLTPAISVLSAVEGLSVVTPAFDPFVVPIAIAILLLIFLVQRRGTAQVGALFGPVMLVWFTTLAALGLVHVIEQPGVLAAVDPRHAVRFFAENGWRSVVVLGSIFLVVTGGESLYADMGHFGTRPIRSTWYALVMPALLLSYFGQGALILSDPSAAANPFFLLAPGWALVPFVLLTAAAAIIASQAVISGAFSLTMQAVQLGYLPRVAIEHTSEHERGQIYVPSINWILMIACIGLVVGFRTSSGLAAAYGVAVSSTMVVTTILLFVVARERWGWGLGAALSLCGALLVIDLAFWGSNMLRVPRGGWFPLVIAALILAMMTTWKRGRELLLRRMASSTLPIEFFLADIKLNPPRRVPGTAIFMYRGAGGTPPALLHTLQHFDSLRSTVILVSVETAEVPRVPEAQRATSEALGQGFHRVALRYGFLEDPFVARDLESVRIDGKAIDPKDVTFVVGRESVIASERKVGMSVWRERLFGAMARNARTATSFFHLPPDRVVEVGVQVEI